MDISRQARTRAILRAQFETFLQELDSQEQSSSSSSTFLSFQGGVEELPVTDVLPLSGDDGLVDSVTTTFSRLLIAADDLVQLARTQLYDFISCYGEGGGKEAGMVELVADFLPQLHQLFQFVRTSHQLAENVLLQLHAFLHLEMLPNSRELPLARVWRALGDLLSTFIVLDELLRAHPFLSEHWVLFLRSIRLAQHNVPQFQLDGHSGRLQQLNSVLSQLDLELMGGNILRNCCQRLSSSLDRLASDRPFMDAFRQAILSMLAHWERLCGTTSGETAIPDKQRLLAILALATLFHHLLPQKQRPDRKMVRLLAGTHRKLVTCHLAADLLFTPFHFLARQVPGAEQCIDRKTTAIVDQLRGTQLDRQLEQLGRDVQLFEQSMLDWRERMAARVEKEDAPPPSTNGQSSETSEADSHCELLFEGAQIADRASRLLKCVLNGHLAEERALSKANVRHVFQLVELVKEIANIFGKYTSHVLNWSNSACAHYASALLCILETNIRQLSGGKQPSKLTLALKNAEIALSQPTSRRALVVAGVSLELANYKKTLRANESQIDEHLRRLDILCTFGQVLARVTDLSFLYWHRVALFEAYCAHLSEQLEPDMHRAKNFFDAFNDCARLFPAQQSSSTLFDIFKKAFLDKLCTEVENDLRMSYHALQSADLEMLHMALCEPQQQQKEPQNWTETPPRLLHLLQLGRVRIGHKIVDVKDFVSLHLESTFYNLSVIALHDCETYKRMQLLARLRYGLHLVDPRLPTRSVDQGLDVVAIMRDVDRFVDNYCYDLDEQFFVERQSQGKLLGVFRVQQVVNSMKTHGIGIVNPLVNSAYRFMRAQFGRLSQLLFDERVKSALVREIRLYRDSINQLDQKYPHGQAERLAQALRRHSARAEGPADLLERFRVLVTKIGNILGLLRMFRAGAVEVCAPNMLLAFGQAQEQPMEDLLDGQNNNRLVLDCARLCDRLAQNISSNLRESNDSIELMTSMFAKEFRGDKFAHLRHFFILIPALSLAHVEYILSCRARFVSRRAGEEARNDFVFVEDGFSMGLAYLLTLLNQHFFFNSLNWFQSISTKFRAEIDQCLAEQRTAQKRKDESLARILAVKADQLRERMAEHRLLMCSLNSALTFLQANEVGGEEDCEESFLDDF